MQKTAGTAVFALDFTAGAATAARGLPCRVTHPAKELRMPQFVDTSPPGQCLFCRLVAGEIPAARVYEDALTLAFMDIGQVNPGHVLVASKRHAATLLDLTPEEAGAVMQTAQRVAAAIQATFDPPGITLLQANGREGEQTVFHFHIHVVPRHAQDGIGFTWPRKNPDAATLQGYAERLAVAIAPTP